jgi:hypothetical protein
MQWYCTFYVRVLHIHVLNIHVVHFHVRYVQHAHFNNETTSIVNICIYLLIEEGCGISQVNKLVVVL